MTSLRLLLAGLLGACGLVLVTPAASQACSCAPGTTRDYVAWADVVFAGALMEVEPPPRRSVMSSSDPNTYSFSVTRSLEGQVGAFAVVESAMSGASCGLEGMQVGREYVVFATYHRGGLVSGLCSGTQEAAPALVERVAGITGAAGRPAPDLGAVLAPIRVVLHSLY
ncbi:hypothetical protein [Nocardioides caricicola]